MSPSRVLLHYRLVEKIGEGAMGEVWKARDTSLERDVAVKLIAGAHADDARYLERFEREAKLMAALHHPNVASVFGVHEQDGLRFIAMEYVPGEDLSERIRRGSLRPPEAVRIARGITLGLEAAHARGVVHRDLKPANVRLTPDGGVKVVDFGLAKRLATAADGSLADATGTRPGLVLGTVPYMSPEQLRGEDIDARSDIWAFGCVLYECLTGLSPFHRTSVSEEMVAILHDPPDLSRLPTSVPPALVRLLGRCLAKDPTSRLHHIADARIELESDEAAQAPTGSVAPGRTTPRRVRWPTALLAVLCGVLAVLWLAFPRGRPAPVRLQNPLGDADFVQLTAWPGEEFDAAMSPSGRFIAFLSDRDGPFEAFVGQVGTGEYVSLTKGWKFDDVRSEIRKVGFVGDGSEVWLSSLLRPDAPGPSSSQLKGVSLLGGPLRSLLTENVAEAAWSPDHERVVYHLDRPGDPLFVADAEGAHPRALDLPTEEGNHQHQMVWSQDGAWIYLTRGRPATGEMSLWRVRPDGRDLAQLTHDKLYVAYPAPIDANTVLYVAKDAYGSGPWLWALDLDTLVSRRASVGLEHYTSVSASLDGRRLVATRSIQQASLFTVPVLDHPATEADVKPLQLPKVRALAPRVRGEDLYFLSSEGTADGIWRKHAKKVVEVWRGSEGVVREPPAISADGSEVGFVLHTGNRQRLYVIAADGTDRRPLSDAVDVRGAASWSPRGDALAVGGVMDGTLGLFVVPVDGGAPRRLVTGEARNPIWSPRGDLIAFEGPQIEGLVTLQAVRPENGERVEVPDVRMLRGGERMRFLPEGSGLVFLEAAAIANLWKLDLATGEKRQLTKLEDTSTIRTFDLTPDGATIVFDRLRQSSDIVLIRRSPSGRR